MLIVGKELPANTKETASMFLCWSSQDHVNIARLYLHPNTQMPNTVLIFVGHDTIEMYHACVLTVEVSSPKASTSIAQRFAS